MLRSLRHPAMVATVLAGLATLAACGTSTSSDPAPPGVTSPSGVPTSAGAQPSVGPSASRPGAPSSTAAPVASGPYYANRHFMINIPQGWHLVLSTAKQGGIGGQYAEDKGARNSILTTDDCLYVFGAPSLDKAAHDSVTSGPHRHRAANVTIGGKPWYHIVERDPDHEYVDDYGVVQGECEYVIDFDFETGTATQRQQTIDSVLATYQKTPKSALKKSR